MVLIGARPEGAASLVEAGEWTLVSLPRRALTEQAPFVSEGRSVVLRNDRPTTRLARYVLTELHEAGAAIDEKHRPTLARRAIELLGLALSETVGPNAAGAHRQALLQDMKAYIRAHIGDHGLGPAAVAQAFAVSDRHVSQLFREGTETVMEFIWRTRLERSKELLAESLNDGSRIKEIAFKAGFKAHSHFTSTFVAEYGVSPKKYRASLRRS
jgi:AraC-like DNA-binding protein